MKKLLLPLLALTLVGCADSGVNTKTQDFGWKVVESGDYIVVYVNNDSFRYNGTDANNLQYRVIAYTGLAEVFVKSTYGSGQEENFYYCGTNVTVCHYEV